MESKILAIPANVINPDEFSKNFNKVFDNLLIENKEKDSNGKEKTISGIKGVPLGYQTMGIFYNWKLMRSVPSIWSEIGNIHSNSSSPIVTDGESVQSMNNIPDYTDILL